ncbi:MAG TPA: hypothetical protein VGF63_09110 [Solirubrobacteraceae bacterium]
MLLEEASTDASSLMMVEALEEAGALRDVHRAGYRKALEMLSSERLFTSDLPLRTYLPRLIHTLETHTWDVQNTAIPPLRNAGPAQVADLGEDDQEALGRNVMQAAEGNAWSAIDFLEDLGHGPGRWPQAFVRGIVLEPFANEDGGLRLKTRQMRSALGTLRVVPAIEREALVDAIVEAVATGKPRRASQFGSERPEATGVLRDLGADAAMVRLIEVADALDAVPTPERA